MDKIIYKIYWFVLKNKCKVKQFEPIYPLVYKFEFYLNGLLIGCFPLDKK